MKKWTPWIVGSLCLATATACNGNRGDNSSSGTAGSGTESGTMQNGASGAMDTSMSTGGGGGMGDTAPVRSDSTTSSGTAESRSGNGSTGTSGMSGSASTSGATGGQSSDTARLTGKRSDSAKGNQTKSGVTNTKTGKSTLGKGVTQTRPDQGEPVTSKGDTIRSGSDTASGQ